MAGHKALLGALLALFVLGLSPAKAQGPTATPAPTPYPLPTGAFSELRPVPTPWQINPLPTHEWGGEAKAGELADSLINGYRYINFGSTEESAGVVDLMLFIVLAFLILRALWGVIGTTTSAANEDDD